jgi:hypothetical protein
MGRVNQQESHVQGPLYQLPFNVSESENFCHSRENGNPEPLKRKYWVPAFAGTTKDFQKFSNIFV